jgi:hypothetical protein
MQSRLTERLGQLARGQGISRVASGSPATLVLLRAPDRAHIRTIDATKALARRGMRMATAKQAIETMLDNGWFTVQVPTVDDVDALRDDLRRAGVETVEVAEAKLPSSRRSKHVYSKGRVLRRRSSRSD